MSGDQVATNYAIYIEKYKVDAERDHTGEVALMADGEIIDYFPTGGEAYQAGRDRFGIGNFSIQQIGFPPAQLGALTPIKV